MEETIFENKFTCTKKYYKDYYKFNFFKRKSIIIINAIFLIAFMIGIISLIFPKTGILNFYDAMVNISSCLIVICIEIYIFYRNIYITYNRELEKNGGIIVEKTVKITEDNIIVFNDSKEVANIQLKNIKKSIKTKSYYILVSNANLKVMLKNNAFIKGTTKDFEAFLKQI